MYKRLYIQHGFFFECAKYHDITFPYAPPSANFRSVFAIVNTHTHKQTYTQMHYMGKHRVTQRNTSYINIRMYTVHPQTYIQWHKKQTSYNMQILINIGESHGLLQSSQSVRVRTTIAAACRHHAARTAQPPAKHL